MNDIQGIYQLLNMHYNQNASQKYTKIVIAPPMFIVSEDQFLNYKPEIKNLYRRIFASHYDSEQIKNMLIKLDLNFPIKETPMPICNKILTPDQPVFRCYDCMTHEASVLCKKCFENANHKGHRYSQIASGGGNCDCGNPDAIKPVGFCVHHPGKAQPVSINQKQTQNFLFYHLHLFEWIFRVHEKGRPKSADIIGQIVAELLCKVNEKSLYYNTLTYKLLLSKRKYAPTPQEKQQTILSKVFEYGIKLINFARKMTETFMNMFSLDIFKYELTVAYSIAYNKYPRFEQSKFKNLYIQLYANNDILERLLVERQIVLYPQHQSYSFGQYVENLMFLSTIKPQVASKFFILLNQKGVVRIPLLDQVEQKVQKGQQHMVSIINNSLTIENYYYSLMDNFIRLIHNCQPSIVLMLQNYTDAVMNKSYSYKKNKCIMPFHKILGMIILSIYKGDLSKINAKQIQKYIEGKYQTKSVFLKVFKMILECFKQFSKTLFETSYFDSYNSLYVKSGNMIILYDLLMFSICLGIFDQLGIQYEMNEILYEVLRLPKEIQQKQPQASIISKLCEMQAENDSDFESISSTSESNPLQILRKLQMDIHIFKIIIQSCISNRSEIAISNTIDVNDPIIQDQTDRLFVQVVNNYKEITGDNLKEINKNFIETKNIQENLIKKFLTFDKNKKKYTLNQIKGEKLSDKKFPLFLCPSLKKFGGIFAQQSTQPLEKLLLSLQIPKQKLRKLRFIFNEKFLNTVIDEFINKLTYLKSQDNNQINKIFIDFVEVIRTLQYLLKLQTPNIFTTFFERLLQLSEQQQFSFLNQQVHKKNLLENSEQEKLTKQIKLEKMRKKINQRVKQKQATYDKLLEKQKVQEEQNQSLCIICKEDKPGLCSLASFTYSNTLQALMKVEGRFLTFTSCFHPIHFTCFTTSSKRNSIPCPLCKVESNVMLPYEKQISNTKTINQIFQRIITLRVSFKELYHGYDKPYEQNGVLSVFRSLTSIIGKHILQGQAILNHKDQRLANILYNMTQSLYRSHFNKKRNQEQTCAIENFLHELKLKIQESKQHETFYVLEYVALKIFYLCLIQKSQDCLKILGQHLIATLNRNDLKKIWDMCGQIVTLPVFKVYEFKMLEDKELSSKIQFYTPPETVFELIKIRDESSNLCKNGHQICICIICQQKSCLDCRQTLKHSSRVHCGECIAFNLQSGGFEYYMDTRVVHFPSLYENEMGFEWKPSKSPQGFVLDKDIYKGLKQQIVNDSILKFLNEKYPEAFKKSLFFDLNLF